MAWAACTACMLELMVPVRACWAEVCKTRRGVTETERNTERKENIEEAWRLGRKTARAWGRSRGGWAQGLGPTEDGVLPH